jgi:CRP/FNR family transcriptional regulator, cyclic AMP receptor protein
MTMTANNGALMHLLSPEEQQMVQRLCPSRRVRKGATLFHSQDLATDLYIVIEGKVKVTVSTPDGSERILRVLGPGDFFGEAFLGGYEYYSSDAVALTDQVIVAPVCLDKLLELTNKIPGISLALARILARRVSELELQLEQTTAPVSARVGGAFLSFAERFGEPNGKFTHLKLDLTHEELAAFVGSTRVTVTNAMGELRDMRLVEGTRGQYEINIPALRNYVEEQSLG